MSSNQATIGGNKTQTSAPAESRLTQKHFQSNLLQPGSLDNSFLNLFQDLFQAPQTTHSSQERDDRNDSASDISSRRDEDSDRPKKEDVETDSRSERSESDQVKKRVQNASILEKEIDEVPSFLPIDPTVNANTNGEATQATGDLDSVLVNETTTADSDGESSGNDVDQLIERLVGRKQDNSETTEASKNTEAESLQEFLARNKSAADFDRKAGQQKSDLSTNQNLTEERTAKQSQVTEDEGLTNNPVEGKRGEAKDTGSTEKSASNQKGEFDPTKEGTIFDRTGKQSNRPQQQSTESGSIQRLRQEQQLAEQKRTGQIQAEKQLVQKQELAADPTALPNSAGNSQLRSAQVAASGNVIKAGQFQVSTTANSSQGESPAVDAVKSILGKSAGTEGSNQNSSVVPGGTTGTENQTKKAAATKQAAPPAKVPAAELINRLSGVIKQAPKGTSQITLQVTPVELGAIELSISVSDGIVNAKAVAENVDAQRLLLEGLDSLKNRLADQGLKVDRFEVELGNSSDFSQSQSNPGETFSAGGQTGNQSGGSGNGQRLPGQNSHHNDQQNQDTEQSTKPKTADGRWAVDVVV